MPDNQTSYEIELLCESPLWWRFNVYIMVAGYDAGGNVAAFNSIRDHVYDVDLSAQGRTAPSGAGTRKLRVVTDPIYYGHLYIYAVANTLPDSRDIKDTPPFPAELQISSEGKILKREELSVNQLGGLTISAYPIGHAPSLQ